ncbi:non-ribosomal peptide synthetase, partial [Clostridium mediterraneense]|uniref:non-ribosomal peptide synthetase n=1 Tax=Clostridium mediterraneense TaxID=1805472 RepID=UPI0013566B90
ELNERANSLARKLREHSIQEDSVVGIMANRSIEMVISIIATLKAGGAYLPIDINYPKERIEFILENSGCKLLLTEKELVKDIDFNGEILHLEDKTLYEGNRENFLVERTAESLIYIIYTSGTTGTPKGVMFKDSSLANLINFEINDTTIELDKKVLQFANLCFDVASQEILSTLVAGGALYLIKEELRKDVDRLLEFVTKNEIKTVFLPTAYFKLLQSERNYIETIIKNTNHIVVAGEQLTLTLETQNLIAENKVKLHNHYGPSETHVVTTLTIDSKNNIKGIPTIGTPIANNKIFILDKMMNKVPINVQGEMYISGYSVARGYLNREELTKERFIENPFGEGKLYKTGDLARWLSDGNIEYLGRADQQIKIRGFRIELGEITNAICKINYVKDAAVINKKDRNGEEAIYAYIVSEKTVDIKDIKKELKRELPEYMVPAYMMEIDSLPLNRNGKLDKRALPEIIEGDQKQYIGARNKTEEIVAEIFKEVIGIEKISIDSDFFEVGGHSLRATKVVNRIEAVFDVRIPIKVIFSERTVEGIALYLENLKAENIDIITKVEEKEYYLMSSAQKRMYLLWNMDKENLAYNMPTCYRLKGDVKEELVKSAFENVINRHEILRTKFTIEDGELVQNILPKVKIDYEYEESNKKIEELLDEFTKVFSLDKGELIRAKLVKGEKYFYLLIDMHHIVSDAVSMAIFIKELSAFYNGDKLSELTLQYKDYSEWMNKRNFEEQKSYWLSKFEEEVPVIDFSYDYNRPMEKSYEGNTISLKFAKEIKDGIKELCRKTGATEYMLLLAAFMVLLNKYTRQEDIVVGTAISGRTNKEMESMMGMFINTLAIREKPENKKEFLKFVYEVKEGCLKAYENQEYPFEELVEAIGVKGDLSRNPLFDVMFGLRTNEDFNLEMKEVEVESVWGGSKISKFDISVNMASKEDGYDVSVEYSVALFKQETIERFLIHFKEVLYRIIDNPKISIGEITIITKEEKEIILGQFNDTFVEYDKKQTVIDLFEEQVKINGDRDAIIFGKEKLTYKELDEKATILARILRDSGIKPEDRVAIAAKRSLEMIIAIVAVIKSGGAYVPIDPEYPEERINYILSDCSPKLLLTYKADISKENLKVLNLEDESVFAGHFRKLEKVNKPTDLLYVIYTSGTTGKPKGVMIEHNGVVNLRKYFINSIKITEADKVLQFSNIAFDGSVWDITMSILTGASLYIIDQDKLLDIDYVSKYSAGTTMMAMPPQYYQQLKTTRKRMVVTAGSESSKEVVLKAIKEGSGYLNAYGPTEATVSATQWYCDNKEIIPDRIPIGKPIDNKKVYIINGDSSLCGIGIAGELAIAGDGLARGYLNRPELTKEKFIDNPYGEGKLYKTGDLARWLSDGNIEYLGRIDEQVKIRGFRIELGEIESVIKKIKDIHSVAVVAKTVNGKEKALYAYLVSKRVINFKEIKAEIRKELPEYMVPSYMMQIEEIPVNRNGKLDKKALPDILEDEGKVYIEARTKIEEIIIKIFKEVTGKEKISIDDDFFEIGGHSLRAAKVVNRIEGEIAVRIPIKAIFSERTVEAIARYIESFEVNEVDFIPKAKEMDYYIMSSAQKRMFLIWEIDKESLAYNMPTCYRLQGRVNKKAIKNALEEIIRRHEVLRTAFIIKDGEPVQKVLSNLKVDCKFIEKSISVDEIFENFTKPFEIDKGNLIRAVVIDSKKEKYLFLDMHHIVSDGMSMGIFIREFNKLYNGEKLTKPQLQYKDYSEWMSSRNLDEQKAYWVNEFEEEAPVIDLPYDYNRASEINKVGALTGLELDKEMKKAIEKLCGETGATEYMVLLSAFMVVLNKYTRQEDIVVGTPISGRVNRDIESLMGVFINTLAMRGKPTNKKSFKNFVKEIKETCLKAYENQEYPFEELVEAVNGRKDFSRNPLFDITFGVQNNEKCDILMKGVKIEQLWSNNRIAKFDLSIVVENNEDGYFVGAEYSKGLFKKETVDRLLIHFKEILLKTTANPEILIGEIEVATKKERELILNNFNDNFVYYDRKKTIVEFFEEQVEKTPNKVALVYENEKLTYRELNEKVNNLALNLRKVNVKPNDYVGIIAERSLEMVMGILAIIKAGAAYIPIDPNYPEERISYIISDCKPKALLTYKCEIETKDIPLFNLEDKGFFSGTGENLEKVNTVEDMLYLIYTSGTTGKPKAVMIKHKNMINYCIKNHKNTLVGVFNRNLNNMGSLATMTFDIFGTETLLVFMNGMTTFIANKDEREDVEHLIKFIAKNHIEILQTTPSRIKMLLTQAEKLKKLKSLKYITLGGEKVEPDLVNKLQEYTKAIIANVYGPSETTVWSTVNELSGPERGNNVSIGKPISNSYYYILQDLNLCGIGVPGEICIAGIGVSVGYLNDEKLTKEKFIDNPFGEGKLYRTGDLARWLPDGNIEFIGRIDEQVKIRGFRIELGEISNVLCRIKYIKDAAVITRNDASGELNLYGYIVSEKEVDIKEVKKELRKNLPEYMVPPYMMQLDKLPVNKNGKLDKKVLPEIVVEQREEYVAPRNKNEEIIEKIFAEVIGTCRVSVDADFFEIGGHSLRATKVVNRIEAETGVRVPIKVIFSEKTIERIANYVENNKDKKYNFIEKAEEKEFYPMSSVQKRVYLLWQMDKENTAYNMPICYKLENKLDFNKVKDALGKLVKRHEILRTAFLMKEGKLVQKILKNTEISCSYEESDKDIKEVIKDFTKAFDLEKGSLVRMKVVRIKAENYLLMDTHHIVSDGMSIGIFIKDFSSFYNGENLSELKLQYKDYSQWMEKRDLTNQKEYWEKQFEEEVPVINLPYDYSRPAEQSYKGALAIIELEKEMKKGIEELCNYTGATEYMVFLSIFLVLLNKYTAQEDIVVGTPISARTNKDMESMMGMFVNTLAIREKPEAKKKIIDFIMEVKGSCLKAYENQEYPFEELVEAVSIKRDLSRNPLFDVMFNLQNNERVNLLIGDTEGMLVSGEHDISKFDLSVMLSCNEDVYSIAAEYSTALFKKETIERFLGHFKEIISRVIEAPNSLIGEIEVITKEEEKLIDESFNNTKTEYENKGSVIELFEERVKVNPNKVALVFKDEEISYRELNERANSLARKLREHSIQEDSVVGIMANRSIEMVISIIATLKAGGAYLPIDINYPKERIEFILENSGCKLLLTEKELVKDIDFNGEILHLEDKTLYEGNRENFLVERTAESLIYIIYTSGTTGTPKGVMFKDSSLANLINFEINDTTIELDKKVLQFANLCFDVASQEILSTLVAGGALYLIKEELRKDVDRLLEFVTKNEIKTVFLPTAYFKLLQSEKNYIETIIKNTNHIVVAGEQLTLTLETQNLIAENKVKLHNHYGPSETHVVTTLTIDSKNNIKGIPTIGTPIANNKVFILDKMMNKVPINVQGEMYISGYSVARGYLNREELTKERFIENPFGEGKLYKTGDLARWLSDGNIEYLGRADQQIKIRGFRIELGEITNAICKINYVKDAAVINKKDRNGEEAIYAYIVSEKTVDIKDIKKELKRELPEYMVPAYMMEIDSLPLNRNGKLDKRAL